MFFLTNLFYDYEYQYQYIIILVKQTYNARSPDEEFFIQVFPHYLSNLSIAMYLIQEVSTKESIGRYLQICSNNNKREI